MKTASVKRFYQVLVVGAVSLTGACDDSSDVDREDSPLDNQQDAGLADARAANIDARDFLADAGDESCCPPQCTQDACVCQGEEIPCCWLVPNPLCENICDE